MQHCLFLDFEAKVLISRARLDSVDPDVPSYSAAAAAAAAADVVNYAASNHAGRCEEGGSCENEKTQACLLRIVPTIQIQPTLIVECIQIVDEDSPCLY